MGRIADTIHRVEAGIANYLSSSSKAGRTLTADEKAPAFTVDKYLGRTSTHPLPSFPGLKAGDGLDIDGPLWADGTGRIVQMDGKVLELQFTVTDPTDLPGLRSVVKHPYVRKDGKLSLTLKIENQDNGKVKASLLDLNDGGRGGTSETTIKQQEKKGWLGSSQKQYVIAMPEQTITLTILGSGKLNVAMSRIPGSFDVTRK